MIVQQFTSERCKILKMHLGGAKNKKDPWVGSGGGQVVSILAFYSNNPSSIPADY